MRSRRDILDLILSDHPLDCMTCEANGNCGLQDLAYEYGLSESSYGGKEESRYHIQNDNPFIEVDPDKCILCGKCVRVDREIQNSFAINFAERGFVTKVATPADEDLGGDSSDCVFCGQCVEVCPTGALTYKPAKGKGRSYDFENAETICPYCGVGCRLQLRIKDGQIIETGAVRHENSPNPAGEACVKGRFGHDFVSHPDRLTSPLIRRGEDFEEVDWDEALDYVADNLSEIRNQSGPDALGGLSSAKCTNEENYLMQKFMRAVIGTNNVDHCARLCHSSTVAGLAKAFGSGAMTNSIGEIEHSDLFFVTGSNPTENHPVIGSKIKKAVRDGAELLVADPREIELSSMADVCMYQRPGTDVALINGMIRVILKEQLWDEDYVADRTENLDTMAAAVQDYTPETVEEITGVPREEIIEAARRYAGAELGSIYFAMGITQHKSGTDNVLALANLAMLCGNVGKKGAGVNPLRGQNNVQGACDLGALPNVYPGYQSVDEPQVREKFQDSWETRLSEEPGLTVVEMMNAAAAGDLRAMYIMGENPMISDPDQNHVRKALKNLDFLVVQDLFLTETAQLADVILPACSFAEKDGTFTNTERRVQPIQPAVQARGQSLPDWIILSRLAEKLDYDMQYDSTAEIMDEISSVSPIYGGMKHDRLSDGGLQWPCPDPSHPGTRFLHQGEFARGKGKFHAVTFIPPAELPDDEYDFILMTGRMLYQFHTGTMTRRSRAINEHQPNSYVEINSEDATNLDISDGERVRVSSRRGTVQTYAAVGQRVQPGQVFMPFHYSESPANRLTNPELDPQAKIPELKVCAVKVEKI